MQTNDRIRKRFVEEGFDARLESKPTSKVYERKAERRVVIKMLTTRKSIKELLISNIK